MLELGIAVRIASLTLLAWDVCVAVENNQHGARIEYQEWNLSEKHIAFSEIHTHSEKITDYKSL